MHREVNASRWRSEVTASRNAGIGNPEILRSAGIPVHHELRGVGENYRDHYAPRMNWRVSLPITLNEQTRGVASRRRS